MYFNIFRGELDSIAECNTLSNRISEAVAITIVAVFFIKTNIKEVINYKMLKI